MDWQQFATNYGLPGLILLGVFLLVRQMIANSHKLEGERIALEREKTAAMRDGFNAINTKLDNHHTVDLQSHSELGEAIAEIRGAIAGRREGATPIEGVPIVRASTSPGSPSGYYPPRKPPREDG